MSYALITDKGKWQSFIVLNEHTGKFKAESERKKDRN